MRKRTDPATSVRKGPIAQAKHGCRDTRRTATVAIARYPRVSWSRAGPSSASAALISLLPVIGRFAELIGPTG